MYPESNMEIASDKNIRAKYSLASTSIGCIRCRCSQTTAHDRGQDCSRLHRQLWLVSVGRFRES